MSKTADITVFVPTPLRRHCNGRPELTLHAFDVRALLQQSEEEYPKVHEGVCDETGKVRRHMNFFVNKEHMQEYDGVDTSLRNGDVVTIMTAVSGG